MSDQAFREAILGAVAARALDRDARIVHASDFTKAVESLGLEFGSRIVEGCLVECRFRDDGSLDYTRFEERVTEARRNRDGTGGEQYQDKETLDMFRRAVHEQRRANLDFTMTKGRSEEEVQRVAQQSHQVHMHRADIRTLINNFNSGRLDEDAVYATLLTLEITPTYRLRQVLRSAAGGNSSHSDIVRALLDMEEPAELSHGEPQANTSSIVDAFGETTSTESFRPVRRVAPGKNQSTFVLDSAEATPMRTAEQVRRGERNRTSTTVTDSLGSFRGPSMQSEARATAAAGVGLPESVVNTSEQRVIRKQIYAALRKVDNGQMTPQAFTENLLSMGVEVPYDILLMLKQYESSGNVSFQECVRAFERYFEARTANTALTEEDLTGIKNRFREAISAGGRTSFQELSRAFHDFDTDNSDTLSYSEFRTALAGHGIDNDHDTRALFNSFDLDGDGSLSVQEFMRAVRGVLEGSRLESVKQAFRTMDVTSDGFITVQDLTQQYDPSNHPDVLSGERSTDEVLEEFLSSFDVGEQDGKVTEEEFVEYFTNVGATIDDDEYFHELLRGVWQVGELPPTEVVYRGRRLADGSVPIAAMSHGNLLAWTQGVSSLEQQENQRDRKLSRTKGSGMGQRAESSYKISDWETNQRAAKPRRVAPPAASAASTTQGPKPASLATMVSSPTSSRRSSQDGGGGGGGGSGGPQAASSRARRAEQDTLPEPTARRRAPPSGSRAAYTDTPFGLDDPSAANRAPQARKGSNPVSLADLVK